jgi:O-antigen ligase
MINTQLRRVNLLAIPRRLGDSRYRYELFRFLLPLLVFGLSAWLAANAARFELIGIPGPELVMLAILGSAFAIAALRDLQVGVLVVVCAALFIQISLGTGSATRIPVSMILSTFLLGLWLAWMLLQKRIHFVAAPTNLPLFGFILISIISLPWSWLFWRPDLFLVTVGSGTSFEIVQLGALALMVILPMLLFLSQNVMRDARWLRAIFAAILIAGVISPIISLTHLPRQFGPIFFNTGGEFPLWVVALLYSQILFNSRLQMWQRVFLGVLVVGWTFVTLGLGISWVSGWAPLLSAIFVLTFLKSKRAAVVLGLLAFAVVILRFDYFYAKVFLQSQAEDFNRFTIWQTVFSLVITHASALFGAGPAGYIPLYRTFISGAAWSSHNNYVDIFGETGILGSLFFAWFLFAAVRIGFTLNNRLKDSFLRAFSNGVFAGLVGMIMAMGLGDWFLPFVYNTGYAGFDWNAYAWILVGAMIGLEHTLKTTAQKETLPTLSAPIETQKRTTFPVGGTPTANPTLLIDRTDAVS